MSTGLPRPWWKQPGEVHDAKGRPIFPGDLIRTPHFIGARRKQHWLYHTAVFEKGYMELVPTSHLQPDLVSGGGRCYLSDEDGRRAEIISGHGPEPYLSYEDRPRLASTSPSPVPTQGEDSES